MVHDLRAYFWRQLISTGVPRYTDSGYRDKLDIWTSKIWKSKHMYNALISELVCFEFQTFMLQYLDFYASISGLLCFDVWTFSLNITASGY